MTKDMIDLSKCKKGDILISRNGAILEYMRTTKDDSAENYYDHRVKYLIVDGEINHGNLGEGTRTNDGFVFRKNRQPEDNDIIAIIPREVFNKIKR
jgi:hypothetical protein